MSEEPVVVREQRGAVLVLRINRPEARNALNPGVMGGVGAGLAEAESNPDIRAVVLTGTGDRSFCAGMDLGAFASGGMAPTPEEQEGMKTSRCRWSVRRRPPRWLAASSCSSTATAPWWPRTPSSACPR
jgi:enoyl-CoA hydratase/carnithine racemase